MLNQADTENFSQGLLENGRRKKLVSGNKTAQNHQASMKLGGGS
jgi:hypothetical protein